MPPFNRRTTTLPKIATSKCTLRITILLSILITFPIYVLNLYRIQEWFYITIPFENPARRNVQCVEATGTSTTYNITQFISHHQLAIFIANIHFARVSRASLKGGQFQFIRTFADCLPPSTRCTIRQIEIPPLNCPPADCVCLGVKIGQYVDPLAACPVLGVFNNDINNYEFSGCIGNTIHRYFTVSSRWPRPFEVVQYVRIAIDLKSIFADDSHANKKDRLKKLMYVMCVSNHTDIIVISNHVPSIPLCVNRTVLARVNDEEALMIMPDAIHLPVTWGLMGKRLIEISTT